MLTRMLGHVTIREMLHCHRDEMKGLSDWALQQSRRHGTVTRASLTELKPRYKRGYNCDTVFCDTENVTS